MSWTKNKVIKIINTGQHLPKGDIGTEMRFYADSERFVNDHVKMQSIKDKVVIYGGTAVNALLKPIYKRNTSDIDVYSPTPKKHAIDLEKSIDEYMKHDISHVEEVSFTNDKGISGKMYRVALNSFSTLADYNKKPSNLKVVKKNGVLYEDLGSAKKKYEKMLREDNETRIVKANQDLDRIGLHEYWKKIF